MGGTGGVHMIRALPPGLVKDESEHRGVYKQDMVKHQFDVKGGESFKMSILICCAERIHSL